MTAEIVIVPLQRPAQYRACGALQQIVWQADPVEVIPPHVLITVQRHGGLVLGAYAGEEMVGFLFGFPGTVAPDNLAALGDRGAAGDAQAGSASGPTWAHCSHIMGVLPEWQGQGIGYRLKLAQREWAIAEGFELITWTYDPLQAGNGVLNLGKLGAVCRCYLRDFYGEMEEELNAGLPTDRFEVAWWVESDRVRTRLAAGWREPQLSALLEAGAVVLNAAQVDQRGWFEPGPVGALVGEQLLVEIPAHLQQLKSRSLGLARRWRFSVRQACEAAFAAGYTACDVVRLREDERTRLYYLLQRRFSRIADR